VKSGADGQIQLPELLFGMSWEDPESDRRALTIQPGETVLTVTSGACNTLTLLLDNPGQVHAVDINPCQSHLLELKCAAIRRLDFDDLHSFLGLAPSPDRLRVFELLRNDLSSSAQKYWRRNSAPIRDGVAQQGRYERFLRNFRRLLGLVQGRRRIEVFFECASLPQQREYFDRMWNTAAWRVLFRLAFNKHVLAKRGLSGDYFQFDDGSASFAESFFNRTKRALKEIPISTNYFLAQYMLGRYLDREACPECLRKENLPVVRERLDRIEIITADAKMWLAQRSPESIDAFSLSNICELMDSQATARTFEQVARTARGGARVCFRNLMVPREVPETLRATIRLQEETSRQLLERDRSFVYSRVQAYVIEKPVRERMSVQPA
jgi:S-adenosylmethionine-diacylglycerol 3-amino-3-carboxypropyl transferase